MERFQYALDLPLGDQRHAAIGDELFTGNQLSAGEVWLSRVDIASVNYPPIQSDCACESHAQADAALFVCAGLKAAPGGIFKRQRARIIQQHPSRIHPQVGDGLCQERIQRKTQIQAGGDDPVNGLQCLHLLQTVAGLFMQRDAQQCVCQHIRHRGQQANIVYC